ncbi:MAG: cell division protein ZapA [Gemmatimonadetes bacterium]|nr:cell division protein ZapA [Gemmatimonadota bacterium]
MSEETRRNVVTVTIAGEEYGIRTEESEAYTRECAQYVDRMIAEILSGGARLLPHKVAVLAAMAITDELFRARKDAASLRDESVRRASRLAVQIEARLADASLAARS